MYAITSIKLNNTGVYPNILLMLFPPRTANPFFVNLPKEFAMTRFALNPYLADDRAVSVPDVSGRTFASANVLAGMLLAALVASLLVLADQIISMWADGRLLAAWVALWTVVFAGMAFLAPSLRRMAQGVATALTAWMVAREQVRTEEVLWELARQDHRVMAEIRMAKLRQEQGL